ncbi:hypothetical protein LZA78_08035 [Sinirhodobacter sp. WL0062]|uniref:Uncharacterized protein n=1 Tax=Rhodobacter flavimaris TaxID=2907145 RepID=A0ABS8YWD1_9RHOB|nr:hypothetical protein [Sinirhodobacter sp. WL0062]MCE5973425.1 hypothetical protein [Sinirhodobacter sp. WL0062]
MKWNSVPALMSALFVSVATPSMALNTLWAPSDFSGAWVEVLDDSQNGCWTNIGEVKAYAADQLELAGFNVIERPKRTEDSPNLSLDKNVVLVIHVKGMRWDNGVCVGSLMTHFLGRVIVVPQERRWVVNTIGEPTAHPLWDQTNFNTILLDPIKGFIFSWVENGKIDEAGLD